MSDRLTSPNNGGPHRGDRIWFERDVLRWRRPTRAERVADWLNQHFLGPLFRGLIWPTFIRFYCWLYKLEPQEYPHMNLTLSTSGSRSTVLEYLSSLITPTVVSEPLEASGAAAAPLSQPAAETLAKEAIITALLDYLQRSPTTADHFSLSANVYIGWQVPTPDGT